MGGGAAGVFEGVDVQEPGLVALGEFDEPGEELPTVGEGGVDETKVAACGFKYFDAFEHFAKGVGVVAQVVVCRFTAVEADGDEIEERKEIAFGSCGQEHGVCRHRVKIAKLFCALGERTQVGIDKGFAAGET
jgi:hypothetical protein